MGGGTEKIKRLKNLLAIFIILSVVLVGINIYQFELHNSSGLKLPANYIQPLNVTSLDGTVSAGLANSMPLTLKYMGHLTGEIVSNSTIYFFITYNFNGEYLPFLSVNTIKNTSTLLNGPAMEINVSTELPPGQWWLNIYSPNSTSDVMAYRFIMNYTPFPTAMYQ